MSQIDPLLDPIHGLWADQARRAGGFKVTAYARAHVLPFGRVGVRLAVADIPAGTAPAEIDVAELASGLNERNQPIAKLYVPDLVAADGSVQEVGFIAGFHLLQDTGLCAFLTLSSAAVPLVLTGLVRHLHCTFGQDASAKGGLTLVRALLAGSPDFAGQASISELLPVRPGFRSPRLGAA